MEQDAVERKLAVILYADVVGYSNLTGNDEIGTHQALLASLDLISDLISNHSGTVVNFAGDAALAEFGSAVNAVKCAVEIQRTLCIQNENLPEERKLRFRIGLNLGDIIVARQDIYGDGVNVAARLEGLARPGGICISANVLEQVKNKLDFGYEYLGKKKVKNIAQPVHVYRVIPDRTFAGKVLGEKRAIWGNWQLASVAMAFVFVICAAAIASWHYYLRSFSTNSEAIFQKTSRLELPTRPSIAVLPFRNISGDPTQDYFSDGVTEDIITDLSKFHGLFVIASNTVFTYKSKPVSVQDVSQDLGVRYVLEGSVQRNENRVRVNAQLIDGTTGHNLWAERFVRDATDLFALQDEIVRGIVAKLAVKVDLVERKRAARKGTDNLEAYDYVLRGRELRARTSSSDNAKARKIIQKAIELDPRYAPSYVSLGWCYMDAVRYGWTATPNRTLQIVHDLAQKALSIDDESASAHRLLGTAFYKWQKYDLATTEFNRALALNPNDADTFDALGAVRLYEGQPDAAIKAVETALRFNPNLGPSGLIHLGLAYYLLGEYGKAIRTLEGALGRNPNLVFLHIGLSAAYAQADRADEATRAAANVRRLHPFFNVEDFGNAFRKETDRLSIRKGLRKAGLK